MKNFFLMNLLLMLPGCMVGPSYVCPQVCVPQAFEQINADSQKEAMNLERWWTLFSDEHLVELVQRAARQNYTYHIALARIEELGAYYQISYAKLFPTVDGAVQMNREHYSAQVAQNEFLQPSQRTIDFLRGAAEVLWEIDLWGRLRRAYRAGYAEYEASVEDARGVYIVLISDVAKAYIDIRALEKNIILAKELIEIDTNLLGLQKDRFDAGLDSNILVQQTRIRLANSKSQLPLLEALYKQTQYGLAVLLGDLPEGFSWDQHEDRYYARVPQVISALNTGLPSELLRRRPDIRQAERLLAASTERIGEAIADFFPRFPLLGNVASASSSPAGWFSAGSLSWFVGLTTQWPVLNFGRVTYNIRAKKAIQRQALLRYANSVVSAFADVEKALVQYYKEQERAKILDQAFCGATKELAYSKDLFNAGLADQDSYLLAQMRRIEIEQLLTEAQRGMSLALVTVYKALGGGWTQEGGDHV